MKTEVSLDAIENVTCQALQAHGAQHWIALEVAKAVRKAEENGNLICGLYYLESYCKQLETGRVKGDVEPVVSLPKPATVKVDARLGFAQSAFSRGIATAVDTARKMGTASLSICHSHTCTSLGYFTEQIAQNGLIGIGFTNASAIVAPPGGKDRVLGTNPIAMAVPAKNGGVAFQFDQSTSAVALGKITMAREAGQTIPLGWALDKNGQPTTDPSAALEGSLVSTGGYKGWGFALMSEVLAAAVTGSLPSTQVKALKAPEGPPHDLGQFYFLIDPEANDANSFWQRLEALTNAVNAQQGTRLPGTNRANPSHVSIDTALWQKVRSLADKK